MSTITAPTPSPLITRPGRPNAGGPSYRPRSASLRAWDRPDPRPMDPHPTVLAPSLMLEVTIAGHAVTVVATGELCRGASHELERLAERLLLAGATAITVDLTDVSMVDAGGLRQLRRVLELASQCEAPARLIGPSPSVARALAVAGLVS